MQYLVCRDTLVATWHYSNHQMRLVQTTQPSLSAPPAVYGSRPATWGSSVPPIAPASPITTDSWLWHLGRVSKASFKNKCCHCLVGNYWPLHLLIIIFTIYFSDRCPPGFCLAVIHHKQHYKALWDVSVPELWTCHSPFPGPGDSKDQVYASSQESKDAWRIRRNPLGFAS